MLLLIGVAGRARCFSRQDKVPPVSIRYLPASHAVHGPPLGPDQPALQVQSDKDILCADELESVGQLLQSADPAALLCIQQLQRYKRLLPRRLFMFSCLTGGFAGSGGTMGDASNLRLPASMLAHTVQLWTCESMFKRAAFLAKECRNLRQAEVLCLHALRRSEKTRDRRDYAHVETLFQFACFHQQFKGDLDTGLSCDLQTALLRRVSWLRSIHVSPA